MAKIIKTVTVALATTTYDDVTKVKIPGVKVEEVATTVFGDLAKGRKPHPIKDFDGGTFETQDPTVYTDSGTYGSIVVTHTFTDDTSLLYTFNGWFDAEPGEIDVEGERKDGYSCTFHVDGVVTPSAGN